MSLMIGWFSFDGPVFSENETPEDSGVFAILSQQDGRFMMLGIEHAENIKKSIQNHEKKECWQANCEGQLCYMVHSVGVISKDEREKIVKEIRMQYEMPCSTPSLPEHGFWTPQ